MDGANIPSVTGISSQTSCSEKLLTLPEDEVKRSLFFPSYPTYVQLARSLEM
ncbi:unnamed protein product [Acanthoscelides obtectus]|uniref:Uncharacterized protein n=1 Tax=Acanthoscelides obtectus TaxID=200917 RepID=A0A9P0KQR7_ACAOB|nr:unnamed protein product [Acanthoscelides obtectus]CAK1641892.1 hypothetical protein AOBTE_LOCUS12701 [Acanthoscelides obtectus]